MRLALRKGLDGRATKHKLNHDKAFYRACEARDEVQELLNAQVATGLVQAVRVTKEASAVKIPGVEGAAHKAEKQQARAAGAFAVSLDRVSAILVEELVRRAEMLQQLHGHAGHR